MSIWRRPTNPQFDRLVRPLRPKAVGEQTQAYFAYGLIIGVVFNCCAVQSLATVYTKNDYYVLSGLGLFIISLLISFFMAWFTVRDCATPDYEILILTPVPNNFIVWGYLRTVWLRMRLFFGLQVGFGLIFTIVLYYFANSNALYYAFPYQRTPGASDFAKYFTITMGFVIIGYLGMCLATQMVGVWLALLFRRQNSVLLATIIVNSLGLGLWFALVQNELAIFLIFPESAQANMMIVILGLIPHLVWLGSLQLAYYVVRRPRRS